MSYKTYNAYKDSDVDWIGKIPSNWKILKAKHIFNRVNNKSATGDEELLSVSEYYGVKPKKETINDGEYLSRSESLVGYKKCSKNDLVMNIMLAWKKGLGITDYDGIVSPAYEIFNINMDLVNPHYINHLLRTDLYSNEFKKHSYGIIDSRLRLYPENFKEIECILPPLKEQQHIAKYLDKQIVKIDKIISKSYELIKLLEEKRVALINHIVTKGLNPNTQMQDSGIEWIGEMPSNWELKKFRNVLKERSEKNNPIKSKERLSLSIDKGVTLYAEKTTNLDRFKDDFTQYKLAHKGDLVLNSMNMIVGAVGVSKYFGCVSPVYYTYYDETEDNTITNYCDYLFKTKTIKKYLRSLGRGIMSIDRGDDRINTCRLKVSRDDLRNMYIPFPPLNEQKEINNYLDEECEKITNVTSVINKHIELLEEYKTSLIHHVVTGKIDVREEVI